jgi:hypothetical protein
VSQVVVIICAQHKKVYNKQANVSLLGATRCVVTIQSNEPPSPTYYVLDFLQVVAKTCLERTLMNNGGRHLVVSS